MGFSVGLSVGNLVGFGVGVGYAASNLAWCLKAMFSNISMVLSRLRLESLKFPRSVFIPVPSAVPLNAISSLIKWQNMMFFCTYAYCRNAQKSWKDCIAAVTTRYHIVSQCAAERGRWMTVQG